MHVTDAMVTAAIRAEYDYYRRGRTAAEGRHIPTPNPVIRAMLAAALAAIEAPPEPQGEGTPERPQVIVTARKPRAR